MTPPLSWPFTRRAAPPAVPDPVPPRALRLYHFDACPYCVKVRRAAARLGVDLPLADTRQDPAALRALREATGGTQVPCLFIDGVPLLESDDIVDWLEAYAKARGPG
jgi:glutaredoxin